MTIAARSAALAAILFTAGASAASSQEPPTAEVQINVCAPPEEIIRRLSLSPDPDRRREIWYFESPALEEYAKGLVFRLRLGAGERRLTLKTRVADCGDVDASLLRAGRGKCEADFRGDKVQTVVSLEKDLEEKTVQGLLDRRVGLASALSSAQVRYLETTRAWPLAKDLRPLGPIRVDSHRPAKGKLVAELWRAPGGQQWAEVSQKTETVDADRVRNKMLEELSKADLKPCVDASSPAESKLRALLAAPQPTPGIR
jgi:hypothetical protein